MKEENPILIKEELITDNKWLNMKRATYKLPGGKVKPYCFATRGKKKGKADAVRVVLYFEGDDGKTRVILIRQFRYPANKVLYETVAGLVEEGQTLEETALREAQEEVGADVIEELVMIAPPSYTSAGMSDETAACFEAKVNVVGVQHLDGDEAISRVVLTLDELEKLLGDPNAEFCLPSRLQLRNFLYKQRLLGKK